MKLYGLYENNKEYTCVGIYTIFELEQRLQMRKAVIYRAISRNSTVRHKYKIERVGLEILDNNGITEIKEVID